MSSEDYDKLKIRPDEVNKTTGRIMISQNKLPSNLGAHPVPSPTGQTKVLPVQNPIMQQPQVASYPTEGPLMMESSNSLVSIHLIYGSFLFLVSTVLVYYYFKTNDLEERIAQINQSIGSFYEEKKASDEDLLEKVLREQSALQQRVGEVESGITQNNQQVGEVKKRMEDLEKIALQPIIITETPEISPDLEEEQVEETFVE